MIQGLAPFNADDDDDDDGDGGPGEGEEGEDELSSGVVAFFSVRLKEDIPPREVVLHSELPTDLWREIEVYHQQQQQLLYSA